LRATSWHPENASAQLPLFSAGPLVDVGGWRLRLNFTGEARASQPTVIFEAGVGDFNEGLLPLVMNAAPVMRMFVVDRLVKLSLTTTSS